MDPTNTRRAATAKTDAPLTEKDKAEREVLKYVGVAFVVFTLSILVVGAGLALTTKLKTPTNAVVGRILILVGGTVSIIVALLFLRL
jgi:tRNA A37 N6-isopentenylltransferase MiaA